MSSFQIYIIYKQNKNITSVMLNKLCTWKRRNPCTKKTKLVMCGSLKINEEEKKILRIQQKYNLTTYNKKYYNLLLQKESKILQLQKKGYGTKQYNTIQYKTMHTGQNTKHTDKTGSYIVRLQEGGGGGEEKKANICVAEDMNCKMKVNMNVLANINNDKTFETMVMMTDWIWNSVVN